MDGGERSGYSDAPRNTYREQFGGQREKLWFMLTPPSSKRLPIRVRDDPRRSEDTRKTTAPSIRWRGTGGLNNKMTTSTTATNRDKGLRLMIELGRINRFLVTISNLVV